MTKAEPAEVVSAGRGWTGGDSLDLLLRLGQADDVAARLTLFQTIAGK